MRLALSIVMAIGELLVWPLEELKRIMPNFWEELKRKHVGLADPRFVPNASVPMNQYPTKKFVI